MVVNHRVERAAPLWTRDPAHPAAHRPGWERFTGLAVHSHALSHPRRRISVRWVKQVEGTVTVRAVAWVPEAETRPWHAAAEFAGTWLRRQASDHGERPGAVTPAIQDYGIPDVDRLGWKTSRRSGRRRVPDGRLAVLAYVPDWESLDFAIRLARDGSIVVVEGFGTKVEGWARWHAAVDLTTGQQSQALPDGLVDVVEQLRFYGNNGFTRGFGRDQALRHIQSAQPIDTELILSALLAAGQSASSVKRLSELIP